MEEYRAAAAEFDEVNRNLIMQIERASEVLRASDNALEEVTKKTLDSINANNVVHDSLKGIFDNETVRNLIGTTVIDPLTTITKAKQEFIVPPGLTYYQRPEERIVEEIAESNRLNRAILEELRKSGQMGAKTTPKKIELQVSVLDFLDWLNNWFLSKEWKNAMPSIEEVDDGYICWGKPERRFDGAIIPVYVKKDWSWLDYEIQLSCQEVSGNHTEIKLYYSPDLEPAVVELVISANKKFRIPVGSESGKGLSENSYSKLVGYTPEQRQLIDEACIGWAGRGYLPAASFNMSEYLIDFFRGKNIYLSVDQFKEALKDAGKRGLIEKVNRRWRLPGTRS